MLQPSRRERLSRPGCSSPARDRGILQPRRRSQQCRRGLDRRAAQRGRRDADRGDRQHGDGVAGNAVNYDVVVVGGGAAGLAAAIAAGSAGARTALVERYGFLGGMATAGMVSTICGLYHSAPSSAPEPLNEGFAETFARRLIAMPGCQKPVRRGRGFVLPYTPFAFACLADELVADVPRVDVYLHAYLVGVEGVPDRIDTLRIGTWERTLELRAR